MDHLKLIRALVARVRWRVRLQTALRRLLVAGAMALVLFGAVALLVKARAIDPGAVEVAGWVAGLAIAVAFASGVARRLDGVALAAEVDRVDGLHSRLSSALSFSRGAALTEFQRAAIEDAATVLGRASPKRAAPWRLASFAVGLALAGGSLAWGLLAALVIEFPVAPASAYAVAPVGPRPAPLRRDMADLLADDRDHLEEIEEALEDAVAAADSDEVRALLDALEELVQALRDNEISAEEAFAKLAALDKASGELGERFGEDLDEVARRLREAAGKPKRAHEEVDPILEALRAQAWKEAAEALEAAADKLERGEGLRARDRKKIARDIDRLAEALETERQRQRDRLERERDRLRSKEDKLGDRLSRKDRDRLEDNERALEQLRREQAQQSQARRQLERLQRELSAAAKEMLRRLAARQQLAGGASGEQLRQAAGVLRRMSRQAAGRRQARAAKARLGKLEEMLRRAGKGHEQQAGRGQEQGRGGEGRRGPRGPRGQGGDGAKGGQGSEMERFLARAGGGAPGGERPGGQGTQGQGEGAAEGGRQIMVAGAGEEGMVLLGPGQAGGAGQGRAPMPHGEGGAPAAQGLAGDGAGAGHDRRLMGAKTRLDVRHQEGFVAGQQGAGASQSVVVFDAASKGFATRAYRDVHQDYSQVVEDALDRQQIPPGKRGYVRRYFDLIRPR
ncbi:MAG: hypothetical protein CSA66_06675 [Proteobacteria bacterium]|nr:MAG: hypothetical protein CSA66_06675 [Pseudomonadota bacterium]